MYVCTCCVYGLEQIHWLAREHWTENLLMVHWTPTTLSMCAQVCVMCARECAHLSTIRLMFINTFCCVEWNCSEPWHRTACFWGLDVHAWVCVLAWPCDTELSKISGGLSATLWLMTVQSISCFANQAIDSLKKKQKKQLRFIIWCLEFMSKHTTVSNFFPFKFLNSWWPSFWTSMSWLWSNAG